MQCSPAPSKNDIKPLLGTFQSKTSRNTLRSSVSCLLGWLFLKLWTNVPSLLESYEFPQFLHFPKRLAQKFTGHSTWLIMVNSEVLSFSCDPQWKKSSKSPSPSMCVRSIFIYYSQHMHLSNKPNSFYIYILQKLNQTNFLPLLSFSLVSKTYAIRKFPPVLEIQPLVVGEACLSYPQVPHSNPR